MICLVCSLRAHVILTGLAAAFDSSTWLWWQLFAFSNNGLRALLARFCLKYLLRLACLRVWTPKTEPGGSFWCLIRPCLRACSLLLVCFALLTMCLLLSFLALVCFDSVRKTALSSLVLGTRLAHTDPLRFKFLQFKWEISLKFNLEKKIKTSF